MKGKRSASLTTPIEIPDEDGVNVDEVITTAVNAILEEAADEVMGSDVEPDAATSGILEILIPETPIPENVVVESIVVHHESDEDEYDGEDCEEKEKSSTHVVEEEVQDVSEKEASSEDTVSEDSEEDQDDGEKTPAVEIIQYSNSDDVPITESVPVSVAEKLKQKKRRSGKQNYPAPAKVSSSTPISYKSRQVTVKPINKSNKKKKSVKKKNTVAKKKRVESTSSDPDVGQHVLDIVPPSHRRKIASKKVPQNVPATPLENISFHTEKGGQRWRYV